MVIDSAGKANSMGRPGGVPLVFHAEQSASAGDEGQRDGLRVGGIRPSVKQINQLHEAGRDMAWGNYGDGP